MMSSVQVQINFSKKKQWFEKHFRKRIRRLENRIVQKMLLWLLESPPSRTEVKFLYDAIEEDPEFNFFERFRISIK